MSYLMNGYQGPLTATDFSTYTTAQSFIPMAGMNGMREVELSQVAQSKAKSAEVRAFAAQMIADHTASNEKLKSLASSKNVSLPSSPMYGSQSYASAGTSGSANVSGTTGSAGSMNHSAMGAGNTSAGMGATGSASTSGSVGTSGSAGVGATGSANTSGSVGTSGSAGLGTTGSAGTDQTSGTVSATGSSNTSATAASDHTAVSSNMNSNNASSGMNNTGSMSNNSSQNNDMASLQNLTGQAFDVQYMRMMLQDHQKAIELFTSAAQSTDPEVKAFATKTLPTLRMHFNHARHVNSIAHQPDANTASNNTTTGTNQ
jgi:predicted outer membrane protein